MGKPLIPELHDIGKLYFLNSDLAAELGLRSGSLHDRKLMEALPSKLNLLEPQTDSWRGILAHHQGVASLADLDVLLLIVADHAGSNISREPEEKKKKLTKRGPVHRTVHKLWNPDDQHELILPGSRDELSSLVRWLATDPDRHELFECYAHLLDARPEELQPPMNVTSLASHLTIVGKIYRFLCQRQQFYTKARTVQEIENKEVDLIKAEVTFPQQIVRTRDMTLFALMSQKIRELTRDDRVLVTTFDQVLAILGPDEKVENLFGLLIDAGLKVSWERARTKVGDLKSTPSALRRERLARLKLELAQPEIPEVRRPQVLARRLDQIDAQYPRGVLFGSLAERFSPPICDLCQMEQAIASWPDDLQGPGPRENLGPRCYALRQNASRLLKLDRWTEAPTNRVAWVYVGLDLDRLVAFLRPLYQKYAQDVGWPQEEAAQIEARPPLLLEFQKDYRRFLADFAASVEEHFGSENLEHVGGETGEAANSLLCVRLEAITQLPSLLSLYLEGIKRYFPAMLQESSALNVTLNVPLRLAISVSGVKFPFSEHWRIIQEEHGDILVNVVGKGQMRAPLGSLPILIETGKPSHRSALHNLVEVARVSEALARVYVEDRERYQEYQPLLDRMRPLGMTYASLLSYAKILED